MYIQYTNSYEKMPDYSKTVIYILRCFDLGISESYVGSTVNPTSRKSHHHDCCINEKSPAYNRKLYNFIRDNGGWQNWELVILEEYPECTSKIQKHIRERQVADRMNSTLNINRAYRTDDEIVEQQLLNHQLKIHCPTCDKTYFKRHYIKHCLCKSHIAKLPVVII